jgi:hypothetical protein
LIERREEKFQRNAREKYVSENVSAGPSPKVLSATELMNLDLPESKSIIDDVLYQGCNLMAAPPKSGKTFLGIGFCLAVASGGRALGKIDVDEGDVLGLFLEDGVRRLQRRMRTMLNGRPAPKRLTVATDWRRLDEGGLDDIQSWIAQVEKPTLLMIDTLKKIRPLEFGNGGRLYDLDYDSVAGLTRLSNEAGIATLINHHTRKMQSTDHIDMASGSLGLTASVDTVMTLKRSRGQADAVLCISGRDSEDKELALQWDSRFSQWNILGLADDYNKSKARREIIDLLKNHGKPLSPREVADLLGKSYPATKKLLWVMAGDDELQDVDGRYLVNRAINNGFRSKLEQLRGQRQ